MKWLLVGFVAVAGILNTLQSGSNATLNKSTQQPVWSAAIVFAVALAAALVMAVISSQPLPSGRALAQTPWWAWLGGVGGCVYILSMMLAADKLGAGVFIGLAVTMAVITSLVLDHYGLMGFAVHKAGVARIAGGALMIAGLGLIARF